VERLELRGEILLDLGDAGALVVGDAERVEAHVEEHRDSAVVVAVMLDQLAPLFVFAHFGPRRSAHDLRARRRRRR
jgi:hypothetical protein